MAHCRLESQIGKIFSLDLYDVYDGKHRLDSCMLNSCRVCSKEKCRGNLSCLEMSLNGDFMGVAMWIYIWTQITLDLTVIVCSDYSCCQKCVNICKIQGMKLKLSLNGVVALLCQSFH